MQDPALRHVLGRKKVSTYADTPIDFDDTPNDAKVRVGSGCGGGGGGDCWLLVVSIFVAGARAKGSYVANGQWKSKPIAKSSLFL